MAIEEYLGDQRKHVFELLDEIESYPAGLQKTLFNYKFNYDEEQEMFSREIIHMYKTGATDPRKLLKMLMQQVYDNPSSDEEENEFMKQKKSRLPNLTCFKKQKEDAANWDTEWLNDIENRSI